MRRPLAVHRDTPPRPRVRARLEISKSQLLELLREHVPDLPVTLSDISLSMNDGQPRPYETVVLRWTEESKA